MKSGLYLLLAVAVALLGVVGLTGQGQGASSARQTWDVKFLVLLSPSRLLEDGQERPGSQLLSRANELGAQGWELASAVWTSTGYALWFKRPK